MPKAVIPLESNPEVFTGFSHSLGLQQKYAFHDVYSLTDQELLSFIPRPSPAIILLFPVTEAYETFRIKEEQEKTSDNTTNDVIWFKQTIKNACGLYALLNSISNLPSDSYEPNSRIIKFKENSKDITKISQLIDELQNDYTNAATAGETEAPDANDDTSLHFIAFIKKNGHIYELDGRRNGAVDLGKAEDSTDDILSEGKLIKRFNTYIDLADDENKLNFSVIALAPSFE